MLAEHRLTGSTGGTAPPYDGCMRNSTILTLSLLLAPAAACGEDAPTRPQDGTVTAWGACVWEGQIVPELCEPSLVCSVYGVCAPTCDEAADCPEFDGYTSDCGPMEDALICKPRCNEDKQCPETGGAQLTCHQGFCIGDLGRS